jgi:multidrug resistance efflux pump
MPEGTVRQDETRSATPGRDPVRGIVLALLGLAVLLFAYTVVADRMTPATAQASASAFLVRLAPEVPGRVVEVPVSDNQPVEAGTVLFRLDPRPFEIAVGRAEAQLAAAGQAVGANTAAVQTAEARVASAQAGRDNVREQAGRVTELVRRGVYPPARRDQANADLAAAEAGLDAALAELERARQTLGTIGAENPQIRQAAAALRDAQLNLLRAEVRAPGSGVVTNLTLSPGQFAAAGQGVVTFIDARAIWISAQMRENQLEHMRPGTPAEVVFDALPGRVFPAHVQSIGWGVGGTTATDAATGLPTQPGRAAEVRRFPVLLVLDTERLPRNLRYGSQATLVAYAGGSGVMDAIAAGWLRAYSVLTYLY